MATASDGRIINDRQAFQHAPIGRPVEDEVGGPHVVGCLRAHKGLPIGHRDLLSPSPSDLQLGFRVQPLDAFVVNLMARLPIWPSLNRYFTSDLLPREIEL